MRFGNSYGWIFLLVLGIVLIINLLKPAPGEAGISFDRNPSRLSFTRHARCRMDCRQINEKEIRYILSHGTVNSSKTDLSDKPCPSFAVEGYSPEDRQHLRVVFGQCASETRVITCIDLDQDHACHCD